MNRRGFLRMMVGGVAATAAVRTFPFRVFSFPAKVELFDCVAEVDTAYSLTVDQLVFLQLESVRELLPELLSGTLPTMFGSELLYNRTATGARLQYDQARRQMLRTNMGLYSSPLSESLP